MWIDVHRCIYAGTYQGTAKHGATGLNAKAAQPLSESELGLVHSNPPVRLPMQATSAQQLRCCTTCPRGYQALGAEKMLESGRWRRQSSLP